MSPLELKTTRKPIQNNEPVLRQFNRGVSHETAVRSIHPNLADAAGEERELPERACPLLSRHRTRRHRRVLATAANVSKRKLVGQASRLSPFSSSPTKSKTAATAVLRYNDFLTLEGIPPETFEYRLGNRSALGWVIDQYQMSTDPRSGITNDPNRPDDPESIVRLLGQVVTVSLETVKVVKGLPALSNPSPKRTNNREPL